MLIRKFNGSGKLGMEVSSVGNGNGMGNFELLYENGRDRMVIKQPIHADHYIGLK